MTKLVGRQELTDFIREHEGIGLTDTEAGMITEYLQSDNLVTAFEDGRYYLINTALENDIRPFESFADIVMWCTRKAETMAEGMIQQINIYNNGEDEDFFQVISQDSSVLAELTGRLRRS